MSLKLQYEGSMLRIFPAEADLSRNYPLVNINLCNGCGKCREACPAGALSIIEGKVRLTGPAGDCVCCGQCEEACPMGAIRCCIQIIVR